MPWDNYEVDDQGAFTFIDSASGRRLRTAPVPSAQAMAQEIDAAKPQQPAPVPDPIAVDQSPGMVMRLDRKDAGETPPPGPSVSPAPPPPPAPPTGAELSTPKEISTPAPLSSQMPEPAASGGAAGGAGGGKGAAGAPGKLVFTPGMDTSKMTPEQVAAYLHWQAAQKAAAGSPGRFVPGGTFPTGRTEQFTQGPDPRDTLAREGAERALGRAQSDLVNVEARKNEELALHAVAQQQAAAERQRQIDETNARQQARLGEIFGQIDQTSKELADAKVDPNRFVKSMSTGQQVLAGVAMLFGGFGRALAGQDGPSQAMQVWDSAIKDDIESQKYNIEKKRGDLNALGQTYKMTVERFGDERLAQDAAYLAGLEVVKAKIQKTVAEADAAQGTETQWVDGQIVAGPPYSIKAKAALAQIAVDQAKVREALSQAVRGQVAQQYVTTQDQVVGGKAPDYAKAAEEADKAAKSLGGDEQQQVFFDDKRYKLGKFAESGEGKETRKELGQIENLDKTAAELEAYLKNNPIGSKTYDASVVKGKMERLSSGMNVMLGQGAKNNDEARRWEEILGGVLTNGVGAVKDARSWLKDLGQRKLTQLNAKEIAPGGGIAPPQALQDAASGKAKTSAGVVGMPRPAASVAPSKVVVARGAMASPLDRATAAVVQAKVSEGKGRASAETLARKALREALDAKQLGPGEYKTALGLVGDGQYEELMGFLGRMNGAGVAPPRPPAVDPALQMVLNRSIRETASQIDTPTSVQTVVSTGGKGKGKGGGPPKAAKVTAPNLMPKTKGR